MKTDEEFQEIQNYLKLYWEKYPQEKDDDPTIEQIRAFLNEGGKYFLKDKIFVIYSENDILFEISCYWCDMENVSLRTVCKTLKNHKAFIKSLNKPIYSRGVKDLFKRKFLVEYDEKYKAWRWL